MRKKDYQQVEGTLKELLTRSRRVVGKRLVVADGSIVIAYHASRNSDMACCAVSVDDLPKLCKLIVIREC